MSAQSEALRLADALEISSNHGMRREAAAELRRLHAERTAADGVINELAAKVRGLQTQRDALLEALKQVAAIEDKMVGSDWEEIEEAREIARAAIKKAEENT